MLRLCLLFLLLSALPACGQGKSGGGDGAAADAFGLSEQEKTKARQEFNRLLTIKYDDHLDNLEQATRDLILSGACEKVSDFGLTCVVKRGKPDCLGAADTFLNRPACYYAAGVWVDVHETRNNVTSITFCGELGKGIRPVVGPDDTRQWDEATCQLMGK